MPAGTRELFIQADAQDAGASGPAALRWSVTRYRYLAFVGLSSVDALEATLLLSLDWR